jgi:putative hydrolase of the HAD superfamily
VIRAVLWDLGGVLFEGPFEAFARYERDHALPDGFIRGLNATNHDTNAWARFERSEVTPEEFCRLFEAEARDAGGVVDGAAVLALLRGELIPEMVAAVRACRSNGLRTACITNNFVPREERPDDVQLDPDLFDAVIESSKVGIRKPDPAIYELACDLLGVSPPECVFLDDLGVNLKPARDMGMTTIKVVDHAAALDELASVLGLPLRG